MKKLLHIIASPRGKDSRTLKVSKAFLENFIKRYPNCKVDELDLFAEPLQPLVVKIVQGKYVLMSGQELTGELKSAWKNVIQHIGRFLSADGYLISTPMWNFTIPYPLKQYIDIIVQPKYLFQYTPQGIEGLVKDKKMVVVASRGGDYGPDSPFKTYDFQEPYLRAIFGFVGIKDITFIIAQPMDALGPNVEKERIEKAQALARKVADAF